MDSHLGIKADRSTAPDRMGTWSKSRGTLLSTGLRVTVSILAFAVATGCQSTPVIEASRLPPEFQATNTYTPPLDLSVLAQESMDSRLVYPGDVLDVSIASGLEDEPPEAIACYVSSSGELGLPFNVSVPVRRVPLPQVEQLIRDAYVQQRVFRDPTVTVLLRSRQTNQISVVGAVERPGPYEIPAAGSDLLAALTKAGGLNKEAGTTIEIRHPIDRGGTVLAGYSEEADGQADTVHVDLVAAMRGTRPRDLSLRDGSVVMVRKQTPQTIYVHGLVPNDGQFELPTDRPLRVTQAVALAGGRDLEIADKVHVTRYVDGRPVVIEVSMREAKASRDANPILAPGDIVSVEETPGTFVVDFARNFFRFGFSSALF